MNDKYMEEALKQAKLAFKNGDIPVGAIIVKDNRIIAKAYNKREKTKNAINHAEIIAIKKACSFLKDWRLNGCTLFVTLEPCAMCIGAAIQARIDKVIYAAKNTKESDYSNATLLESNNKMLNEEASLLLKQFFKNRRK